MTDKEELCWAVMTGLVYICALCVIAMEVCIILFYGDLLLLVRVITISMWIIIPSMLILFAWLGFMIGKDIYFEILHYKKKKVIE